MASADEACYDLESRQFLVICSMFKKVHPSLLSELQQGILQRTEADPLFCQTLTDINSMKKGGIINAKGSVAKIFSAVDAIMNSFRSDFGRKTEAVPSSSEARDAIEDLAVLCAVVHRSFMTLCEFSMLLLIFLQEVGADVGWES